MYPKGMEVYYKSNAGGDGGTGLTRATILSVHQDEMLEPYYTIKVGGREKQTAGFKAPDKHMHLHAGEIKVQIDLT